MKRFLFSQTFSISHLANDELIIDDDNGGAYRLTEDGLELLKYDQKKILARLPFNGETCIVVERDKSTNAMGFYEKVISGEITLETESGQTLDIEVTHLTALFERYIKGQADGPLTYFAINNPQSRRRRRRLFCFDWVALSYSSIDLDREYDHLIPAMINNCCYGVYGYRPRRLVKVDKDLAIKWDFTHGKVSPETLDFQAPFKLGQHIFSSVGAEPTSENSQGRAEFINGEIVCVDDTTGQLTWSKKFDYQIDSLKPLNDKQLIALVANKLHILDADTSITIKVVDTGLEAITCSGFLFLDDTHCYLINNDFNRILFYDKIDFRLAGQYLGEEGRTPLRRTPAVVNGLLMVKMGCGFLSNELLVINPAEITEPLQIETLDSFNVTIPEQSIGPIIINIEDADVSKVLRHTEHHAYELADCHGREGRGLDHNKLFNGELVLRYKGWSDELTTKKYLDRLVERVGYKYKISGIFAGVGSELCNLRCELIK